MAAKVYRTPRRKVSGALQPPLPRSPSRPPDGRRRPGLRSSHRRRWCFARLPSVRPYQRDSASQTAAVRLSIGGDSVDNVRLADAGLALLPGIAVRTRPGRVAPERIETELPERVRGCTLFRTLPPRVVRCQVAPRMAVRPIQQDHRERVAWQRSSG